MGTFHFLNVKEGDCSIIQHGSRRVSVIDVSNARHPVTASVADSAFTQLMKAYSDSQSNSGNFGQKDFPVNPIEYMRHHGITDVFRFILTHPDMDHMDGIKDFCEAFPPTNFWDTKNTCEKDWGNNTRYREEDWDFYSAIHDGRLNSGPKRLTLHSGDHGQFYNRCGDGSIGGDGITILAPTPELVANANDTDDHNDASYVILYNSPAGRIIVAGDSHDETWDHIIAHHKDLVENVDLLVAPHHGRHSDRDFSFLDILRPKLTLFGNASSEHLAYGAWNSRGLPIITNNQANCVIVDTDGNVMQVYGTNETFARSRNSATTYSVARGGWYLGWIAPLAQSAAE